MSKEMTVAEYKKHFASMGGKASAASLTPAQRRERARKGGKASAASLTPEQRRARARKGGNVRQAVRYLRTIQRQAGAGQGESAGQ